MPREQRTGRPTPALGRPVGVPLLITAVVVVLVAHVASGPDAALSAAVGAAVAPIFLGLTVVAARVGALLGPEATLVLVLMTYFSKFAATGLVLALLHRQAWVDRPWVVAAVLSGALVWVVGHVVATWRHRGLVEVAA